ncbi:LysM peptidoglycan-binding domain-containing protein [Ramlibacter sp.]|uniref:LysM peptidoglycan-binding domain-containing protein n=1 Tax=Ramlibacter sp. TaxID=1917967 RepID=UPI003D118429
MAQTRIAWAAGVALAAGAALCAGPAAAQFPVTPGQRATAQQVAQAGVALSELAPDAPERYTVKRGDTLWGISGLFLRSAWRWPELWGMNIDEVRNPHRIYPGQQLVLEKSGDRARLRLAQQGLDTPIQTLRVSPRVRIEPLAESGIPTLQTHLVEPFLAEPVIVGEGELERAPRIVAVPENRVLITRGDRAYVRGSAGSPLVERDARRTEQFRVFRSATPLRDPATGAVLGYEAQYIGGAQLVRGESTQVVAARSNAWWRIGAGPETVVVPATIDIVRAKEEIRVGDRLLPEPPRQLVSYVPRAPAQPVDGMIVSVYGEAVVLAGQNQVVVVNKGTADGLESGHVLAIMKAGQRIEDKTQGGERAAMRLPDERNGLLMVFRPFERLSYALILEITDAVKVGDRIANPR